MTLDELNTAHRCMMGHLRSHLGHETFASDMAVLLAGMVAEMVNNLAKPGDEQKLLAAFEKLVKDRMRTMQVGAAR